MKAPDAQEGVRYTCSDGSEILVERVRLAGGFDLDIDCSVARPDGTTEKVLHCSSSWDALQLRKKEP